MIHIAEKSPEAPHWTREQYRSLFAPQHQDGALQRAVFLAEWNEVAIGFAVASTLCSVVPAETELESIAVLPEYRQRGVGSTLIASVTAWAADLKAGCLRLEVRAGNARALRLYAAQGFLPVATRRDYYANPQEDAVYLERTV